MNTPGGYPVCWKSFGAWVPQGTREQAQEHGDHESGGSQGQVPGVCHEGMGEGVVGRRSQVSAGGGDSERKGEGGAHRGVGRSGRGSGGGECKGGTGRISAILGSQGFGGRAFQGARGPRTTLKGSLPHYKMRKLRRRWKG